MINIDKVSIQYKNYKYRIFVSFFVFSVIVLITIISVHVEFSKDNGLRKFKTESHLQSEEKAMFLHHFLQKRKDSLIAIRDNPYFREFASHKIYPHNTDFLFFTLMQENKDYMQMRFLDIDGKEQLRFDRRLYGKAAYKVENLQDKSNRYYFKKTLSLKDNEIFLSKLDFNMEKGEIQKPYVPVLRVATPVYIHDKIKGVLIINIFIDKFMELLTSSPIFDISIVGTDGYVIKKYDRYYDKTQHIKELYDSKTVNSILKMDDALTLFDKNLFMRKLTVNNQKLIIIYESKTQLLNNLRSDDIKMTAIILLITILISIPFAFLLSVPINDMFRIVLKQADKLHELATTLDKKVEEEILKNAKQDRLIQHQSKQAALGDMIGNIAHQWRHPLTRLSLLLQNLKAYKNKQKMSDEIFFDTLEKSNNQIEFMSNTIDNFKDFYKTDKEKNDFNVNMCIDDVLNIIGSVLDHNNIKFVVEDSTDVFVYGIKNQLSQVLLNLIVNAKDALQENEINDPVIFIRIYKEKNKNIILVEDNAGGIPLDIIDDIFAPFFTTKAKKGTGIGLYLSRTIIEDEMKGKLSVLNVRQGALFTIEL